MRARTATFAPLFLSLACAGQDPSPVEPPEPQATIVVQDPIATESVPVLANEDELVTVRLFVVSRVEEPTGSELPEEIQRSSFCEDACDLLLSPMFLGRNHADMALEVGPDDRLFSLEAKPRILAEGIELELEAQFMVEGEGVGTQRFSFEGTLPTGEIVHVGTFHATDHRGHVLGPQVFAVVDRTTGEQ